jgi:hypothetical protein
MKQDALLPCNRSGPNRGSQINSGGTHFFTQLIHAALTTNRVL